MRGAFAVAVAVVLGAALHGTLPAGASAQGEGDEVRQAICRIVDKSAAEQEIPAGFFARLIWRESSFRSRAVSPKGAQGIAQFMPGTALERGLNDPFDPEQALPAAAKLLRDLRGRFGNLGLAAAAYNAGPRRVEDWLAGRGGLPAETQLYVRLVTGVRAEDWTASRAGTPEQPQQASGGDGSSCLTALASMPRRLAEEPAPLSGPAAPFGVQLAGDFSKERALRAYERVRARFSAVLANTPTMVIGTVLRSRGTKTYYRVRAGQPTRSAALDLCRRLQAAGGACMVLRN